MELSKDLINDLLKKIGKVLTKAVEESEEITPRESFTDMYINGLEYNTPKMQGNVKYVYLKPKVESQVLLQEMEAISKVNQELDKRKKEADTREAQIADQHYSLQKAKQEINGDRTKENRGELQGSVSRDNQ